jgi:hypothetical protein
MQARSIRYQWLGGGQDDGYVTCQVINFHPLACLKRVSYSKTFFFFQRLLH